MGFRLVWLFYAGIYYFPCIMHLPIVDLDPGFMIEDTAMRVLISIVFWGVLIFYDGSGRQNSPVGGY